MGGELRWDEDLGERRALGRRHVTSEMQGRERKGLCFQVLRWTGTSRAFGVTW